MHICRTRTKSLLLLYATLACMITLTVSHQDAHAASITPRLAFKPSALWFGNVTVGTGKTLSVTMTNTSAKAIKISKLTKNTMQFSVTNLPLPVTLQPTQSKTFQVSFRPKLTGRFSGSVALGTNFGTFYLYLHGSGVTGLIVATPAKAAFGSVAIGESKPLFETLTNSGSSSIKISKATIFGGAFSFRGLSLPITLAAGHSYTFTTVFHPKVVGALTGTLIINSTAPNTSLKIALAGNGVSSRRLNLGASTLNFGSVTLGKSMTLNSYLAASGADITVSSATSNSSEFQLTGISFPHTIAAGQKAFFSLKFTPRIGGTASGSIAFKSNASNSPAIQKLSGAGIGAAQHRVVLSWSPSTSGVAGYNIYRSSTSGGSFVKINPVLNASTTFVDSSVQSGHTYFYVTTSVTTRGVQSRYSNQVKAVIP